MADNETLKTIIERVKNDPDVRGYELAEIAAEGLSHKIAKDESGWLIERADSDPSNPKYWCAGGYWQEGHDPTRTSSWTSDHMEAIRFARKDDAERVAQRMMKKVEVRICEHGWG